MGKNNNHQRPCVLVILDGWGIASKAESNPITLAHTPNFKKLWTRYPHAILQASGKFVGLPPGQEGNSEAGHLNIGGGRVVKQDAVYISESIRDGSFNKNAAFKRVVEHVKKHSSTLHLMGLLSSSNSGHSQPDHIQALLRFFREQRCRNIALHLFTDGRDTRKFSAIGLVAKLQKTLRPNEKIVTLMGRFWAMDRKKDWGKTEAAYHLLAAGVGRRVVSAERAIRDAYKLGESDEFISPSVIAPGKAGVTHIKDHDAVIFFNLRSDRARQLAKPFVQRDFNRMNPESFRRKKVFQDLMFVAMTDFGPDLPEVLTAFPSRDIVHSLPAALCGLRQLYVAESEKYAHITYFLNGGYSNPVANEQRIMVSSPNVDSYDKTPEMSAREITNVVIDHLTHDLEDVIGLNFSNADMVGHTGNLKAGIIAVEVIDECIGRLYQAVQKNHGILIITADHGNIEKMFDLKTGTMDTEHSTNPVPFLFIDTSKDPRSVALKGTGSLSDVAPTMLEALGRPKPPEMTGKSLFLTKARARKVRVAIGD